VETQVKVLGVLHIVLGGLGVLAAVGLLALFGGIAGVVHVSNEPDAEAAVPILGLVGTVLFVVIVVVSLPGIIAGIGLLQYREWARILTIVLSVLDLLNIPFGTALGIYGLIVLFQDDAIRLFRNPPARPAPARW